MITAAQASNAGDAATAVVVAIIGIALWMLPIIIGAVRKVPNMGSIAVIDIFLGWTIIGWIVALAMACRSRPQPQYMVPPGWGPRGDGLG